MITGLGVPVPLTFGFGTKAANRAMKSTGSKAGVHRVKETYNLLKYSDLSWVFHPQPGHNQAQNPAKWRDFLFRMAELNQHPHL